MDVLIAIGALVLGVALGVITMLLFRRARDASDVALRTELATAGERLAARDRQIQELKESQARTAEEVAALRQEATAEAQRRAAAEGRAEAIPRLDSRLLEQQQVISALQAENTELKSRLADIEARRAGEEKAAAEKLALLNEAQRKLADAFTAVAAQALESNNQSFLQLAKTALETYQEGAKKDLELRHQSIDTLVKPLTESLTQVNTRIQEIEIARTRAYASLEEQLRSVGDAQRLLRTETGNLVKALRAPQVRGRWGEVQLQRVVELAGMVEYVDFVQQESADAEAGRLRPDMVVRLPNHRKVVIDAKTPIHAYLEALEAPDDATRLARLRDHARHVREHLARLSEKRYWGQFDSAPEFVVLFLPGETFFAAALEQDPQLIEFGAGQQVILATPTTLIALLKAVAYGWRHEQLARNAQQISDLGREMYERIAGMAAYLDDVRKHLQRTVEAYNRVVPSFESRLLVSARKFKELGAATADEPPTLEAIDAAPRMLETPAVLMADGSGPSDPT
jgi:DNA recombination protein RmuC